MLSKRQPPGPPTSPPPTRTRSGLKGPTTSVSATAWRRQSFAWSRRRSRPRPCPHRRRRQCQRSSTTAIHWTYPPAAATTPGANGDARAPYRRHTGGYGYRHSRDNGGTRLPCRRHHHRPVQPPPPGAARPGSGGPPRGSRPRRLTAAGGTAGGPDRRVRLRGAAAAGPRHARAPERVGQACRDAVLRSPKLPCAGRTVGVKLLVDDFVGSVELLAWAVANGCPCDSAICGGGLRSSTFQLNVSRVCHQ